ncbi:Ig-like domain-containing protein [Marinobacterium nitratireducens]|uniref:Ig-like domain-containing protein n=1 Tax=Marinobacterium nitratireducens TaxID=518897 RepID=UPI00166E60FE|nr:Ig-like domain-containing protein [Marinobacterium nitratireducens]
MAKTAFAAILGSATLPAFAVGAHDHDHATTPVAAVQARQQAAEHTQALMALQKRWEKAQGAEKSRVREQMVAKAEERRAFLLELMKSNPAEVLNVIIPEEKQLGMPAEVVEKLEQRLELEGELESTYLDNFENPALSRQRHELKTPFGERFELHFADKAPDLPFGAPVRAYGVLIGGDGETTGDGAVVVGGEDNEEYPIAYAGADGSSNTSLETIANDTFGAVRTLVLLVNFKDKQEQPYTQAFAKDMVFNQVSDYFRENSYGQSWLTGDVTPWMTLPINSTDSMTCYGTYLWDNADVVAQNAGYDLSQYDRLLYVTPNAGCSWGGAGQIGGSRTTIDGSLTFQVTAHELGHNYGLQHSHSLACTDGSSIGTGTPALGTTVPWSNCREREYGDLVDVMGDSRSAHFHANQKELLGWLEYGNSPDITEITQSGRYEIDVMASQTTSSRPKALKVLKAINPDTGYKSWYYLELRQPVGYDSIVGASMFTSGLDPSNVTNGVLLHATYGSGRNYQWLLDMTPGSASDMRDPALEVGETFFSPDGDLSITTESVDGTRAVVNISYDGAPVPVCSRANPSLSFTPSQGPWVAAGTAVSYTVTLKNNDSSDCSNSSFSLGASKPSGWSAVFGTSTLSLAPGASKSTTLTVTSAGSATDGFYNIGLSAAGGGYGTTGNVTYVVDNPVSSNTAPVAKNDSASTTAGTAVTINVLANDSDPDGDTLTVSSTSGVNGTAKINANGSITFTPASGFSGTETFNYSISDGRGGNASASVSVSVAPASPNKAPVAVDDHASTTQGSAVTIAVLGNDYDPDGDKLTVTGVTQGSKGSVRINADGSLTFSPAKNFKNGDSFGYTISDGKSSASATVSVSVTASSGGGTGGPGNGKGPNK